MGIAGRPSGRVQLARVFIEVGVERRRPRPGAGRLGVAGELGRRTAAVGWCAGGVGAPLDADGAPLLHLVGHGIAQRRHRATGADEVAVAVQQAVELAQAGRAVPAEDLEAGAPERPTPDGAGGGGGGRQRCAVEQRRPPPPRPLDGRVQDVTEPGEGIEDDPTVLTGLQQRAVDVGERAQQRISLHLELEAAVARQPRLLAHPEQGQSSLATRGDVVGLAGSHG